MTVHKPYLSRVAGREFPALQLDIATLYDERSALRCTHRLLYLFALHFTFYRWNSRTGDDVVVVASSRLSIKEDSKQPSSLIGNVLCEQAICVTVF